MSLGTIIAKRRQIPAQGVGACCSAAKRRQIPAHGVGACCSAAKRPQIPAQGVSPGSISPAWASPERAAELSVALPRLTVGPNSVQGSRPGLMSNAASRLGNGIGE